MPRKTATKASVAAAFAAAVAETSTATAAAATEGSEQPAHEETSEEIEAPKEPLPQPATGVVFINNFTNRKFVVSPTKTYQFTVSRELITGPELIEYFTGLAKAGNRKIIIESAPVAGN